MCLLPGVPAVSPEIGCEMSPYFTTLCSAIPVRPHARHAAHRHHDHQARRAISQERRVPQESSSVLARRWTGARRCHHPEKPVERCRRCAVTINLGLYWPEIQQAIGRAAKATPPRDADCTVFQRLGFVACDGRDVWWTIREEADIAPEGADVVQKLRDHGLPWLSAATTSGTLSTMPGSMISVFRWMPSKRISSSTTKRPNQI